MSKFIAISGLILALAASGFSQYGSGVLLGTITDPSGAVVPARMSLYETWLPTKRANLRATRPATFSSMRCLRVDERHAVDHSVMSLENSPERHFVFHVTVHEGETLAFLALGRLADNAGHLVSPSQQFFGDAAADMVVLQRSRWLLGCRERYEQATPYSSNGGISSLRSFYVPSVGICASACPTAMCRNCWRSAAWNWIILQSGVGYSGLRQNSISVCAPI
jgi:hypothetical protein